MNNHFPRKAQKSLFNTATVQVCTAAMLLAAAAQVPVAAAHLAIWDTASPFSGEMDRQNWNEVPMDITRSEANPPKAASDPGYYGRSYRFQGDAVVENQAIIAVFASAQGKVLVYPKFIGPASAAQGRAEKLLYSVAPLSSGTNAVSIQRCDVLRYGSDMVRLAVLFGSTNGPEQSAVLSFGRDSIVEVKPGSKSHGFEVQSQVDYGVAPSFVGDDLIVAPNDFPSSSSLSIPCEQMFVGLVRGGENMLVLTWPKGEQRTRLNLTNDSEGRRFVQSIGLQNDGRPFYLANIDSPGIWHHETLSPSFLEKDVAIEWKKPFSANWKTQLEEAGTKATFSFRSSKNEIWRGVPGSYTYPVWFQENQANFRLSKKVPPKGESIIYFLEGQDTPASILTPVDILQNTLGRVESEAILDPTGRTLRTHHRRAGAGVHRACTCGCTEAIQAVFEAGHETDQKEYIDGAIEDMIFFIREHLARIDEYRTFAENMAQFLHAESAFAGPELKSYFDNLEQIVSQIPQEYSVQLENMKSLKYASELRERTLALTSTKDPKNLEKYMELLKEWRGMGGAQDYVVAQCHVIARKLLQEAGSTALDRSEAASAAIKIRERCRQVLRNPDGYEVWANY